MSEVMLLGVLRMPLPDNPAEISPLEWPAIVARMRQAADELETAWAERDAARALADKLAEALRPIAEISACYDPDDGDDEQPSWDRRPTIGMLRAARAAIAEYDAHKDAGK